MNTPKWIPKHSADTLELFSGARQLERDLRALGKTFATNVNLSLPDYYEFGQLLNQSRDRFEHSDRLQRRLVQLAAVSADQRIERSPYKRLQSRRATLCRLNVKRRHSQLTFVMQKMIRQLLGNAQLQLGTSIDSALIMCTVHNASVHASRHNDAGSNAKTTTENSTTNTADTTSNRSGALVCSNSFAGLMLPAKKIDLYQILHEISRHRSELCCMALITCLLATCSVDLGNAPSGSRGTGGGGGGDDTSDTSSVEILRALTVHLAASPAAQGAQMQQMRPKSGMKTGLQKPSLLAGCDADDDPTIDFFDKLVASQPSASDLLKPQSHTNPTATAADTELLDQLVANEENYVANILLKCLKLCPSAFDAQPNKTEIIRWVNRGTRSLWTQVGSTLEHVVLWWSPAPLACRPAVCARHLRDWLLQLQLSDAPEPVLSTLRGLGETLTVYVAGTMWDRQFRLALVAGAAPVQQVWAAGSEFHCAEKEQSANSVSITATGRLWSELLYGLTAICNSCDSRGTMPSEMPIVEQIPVLHRLDHSVHTMRLWAVAAAKALCTDWSVGTFFRVAHGDIGDCLEQLRQLRVPELAASDATEVLVQVCVALRAKLVSEIRVNIAKLMQTTAECIEVMSSICRTISLATLSLCFPVAAEWQTEERQTGANDYVRYYFNEIYLPVVRATQLPDILGLVLKLMCEAWLDHIYMKRIRFSRVGAENLQRDFDGVPVWLMGECRQMLPEQRERLARHEVLRMCDGVARILLRKPDDVIAMQAEPTAMEMRTAAAAARAAVDASAAAAEQSCAGDKEGTMAGGQLPPEMFVPNQQRWLELRARNRSLMRCLACACLRAEQGSGAERDGE